MQSDLTTETSKAAVNLSQKTVLIWTDFIKFKCIKSSFILSNNTNIYAQMLHIEIMLFLEQRLVCHT